MDELTKIHYWETLGLDLNGFTGYIPFIVKYKWEIIKLAQ